MVDTRFREESNKNNIIIIKKLHEDAIYPTKGTKNSAGIDFYALENTKIENGKCKIVPTGLSVFIPDGNELQIRPRSGMSLKGVIVIFGTVDSDYSGMPIGIMVLNCTGEDVIIKKGSKIAQGVFSELINLDVYNSKYELICISDEERLGGFGSTGF